MEGKLKRNSQQKTRFNELKSSELKKSSTKNPIQRTLIFRIISPEITGL